LANTDAGEPNPRALARRLAALAAGRPYRTFRDVRPDAQALQALAGAYRIEGDSHHLLSAEKDRLYVRRDQGPQRRLVVAEGDLLYYAGDGTDYLQVVRDGTGQVTALDFFVDGMPPTRREMRIPAPDAGVISPK
jgi:D-alanyl-D-alanine carboxypeptidase